MSVDLRKLSAPGMYINWTGPQSDILEWTKENDTKAREFKNIMALTQQGLRESLKGQIRDSLLLTKTNDDVDLCDDDPFDDPNICSDNDIELRLMFATEKQKYTEFQHDDTNSSTNSSEGSYIET
jgi:hypothetical protein